MHNFAIYHNFVTMPKTPPLSVAEAAARTRIPKRTIQAAITRGDLKAHKLSGLTGAYVIEPRALDRYLDERERKAGAA